MKIKQNMDKYKNIDKIETNNRPLYENKTKYRLIQKYRQNID